MKQSVLAAFVILAAGALAAAPVTILEDSLGSGLSKSTAPANWNLYRTKVDGRSGVISEITLDGKKAVNLLDDSPGEIGFSRNFKVTPGTYLQASIEAALPPGAKMSDAFKLQLTFRTPKLSSSVAELLPENESFAPFVSTCRVPDGANELIVYVYSHKSPTGAIALRNFKLESNDQPYAPPVQITGRGGILQAELAALNAESTEVIEQDNFSMGKGVSLKRDRVSGVKTPGAAPDLVFDVRRLKPGRYELITMAATDEQGAEIMRRATSKFESMYARYQVGEQRPTERVIYVPWASSRSCNQNAGKFYFTAKDETVKIWLPAGVRLDYLQIRPYVAPAVPKAVQNYQPRQVPPASRPRLWVNAESLPKVRADLTAPENLPYWKKVQALAAKPFEFQFDPAGEVKFNTALENAAAAKAFVYLMTGDRASGLEAVKLTRDYISHVEFGNLLDITREIGAALYSAARVYDWCYDLMTPADREAIRSNMMRLCDDMECGWPPFLQTIVNGHGNEAQINRDLLSMSIAIYDEDPTPYRYCSYVILEQLVPMRKFEYQSSRHNQGVGYGAYRFGWDMHAAWLFRRMTGQPVFDDNIKDVYKFWQYMRMPNGEMFRDGDGIAGGRNWSSPMLTLLCYAYAADPVIKGEFFRYGGSGFYDPILFLLLNDPALPAEKSLESLPLTHDFGPILGGMIARTGWNIGRNSPDVVAEFKGGGYHFGNHKQSDAGSFQIYFRGLLAAKLGIYKFYGTPYDMNFNKRSIAQPMLLAVDPNEKFLSTEANDGGSRLVQSLPTSPEQAMTDPVFNYGKVLSGSFGPSKMRPLYSYFSASLTGAYSAKITGYVRSFCFLNLGLPEHPAVIVMVDDMTTADPAFRKYWQINTLNPPELTDAGAVLHNASFGVTGKLHLDMVRPAKADRTVEVLSGKDANSVFGKFYTPPSDMAETRGHRIMFAPVKAAATDRFFVVMQLAEGDAAPLPAVTSETDTTFAVAIADRVVSMAKGTKLLDAAFSVTVPAGPSEYRVLAAGLQPGDWNITGGDLKLNAAVEAGKNTVFFVAPAGEYRIAPGKIAGAPLLVADETLVPPAPPAPAADSCMIDGKIIAEPKPRPTKTGMLVPAVAVLKAAGAEVAEEKGMLAVTAGGRKAVFQPFTRDFTIDGNRFTMTEEAVRDNGVWFLPDQIVAVLAGYDAMADDVSRSVSFVKNHRPKHEKIMWAESNTNPDQDKLTAMLSDSPNTGYWDGFGKHSWIKLVLAKPLKLKGVGIQFFGGNSRQAKFSIELSTDGVNWSKVFDGVSSGTSSELEVFSFAPQSAAQVRFNGYGNNLNEWNSIVRFQLIEE